MALRRFLFQALAAGGSGYLDSSQDTDDLNVNSIALKMASGTGTALDANTNDVANVRKLTLVTGVGGISLDAGGQRVTNLATPTQATDAVTKSYADALQAGLDWKASSRAASTANVTVSGPGAAIDGVTLSNGDRVLLKNQTAGAENGIYIFNGAASPMTRSADAVAGLLSSGAATFVTEGTTNADVGWIITTADPITVGTTSLVWTQFTALGQVTAGAGLTKTGAVIDLGAGVGGTTCDGITIAADSFAVNLDTSAGLQFDASSPKKLQVKAGAGVSVGAGGVAVSLAATSGLGTAGGLAVGAGNGITVGTNTLSVTANASQGINVSGSGVGITLMATPGLQFSTGLGILLDPTNPGLQLTSGLKILLAATSGLTTTGGLAVGAGNGITVGANTIAATPDTTKGMAVSGSGLAMSLNGVNPGLAFTSTYVDVKYDGARGITAGAAGIGLALAATPGLTLSGNALAVLADATTTGGLGLNSNGLYAKLNGTTLAVSPSLGLSVLGVPAAGTWQIGGVATSANVTAPNLGTLTGGGDASALHTHAGLSSSSVGVTVTAGLGGLAKGDPLYFSANGTCLKGDPSNNAKSVIAGIAGAAISAAAQGTMQRDGILAGVGSAWTFGQQIFMSNSGGLTNDPTTLTSRYRTIQLGVAVNATDLLVSIVDYGMKP